MADALEQTATDLEAVRFERAVIQPLQQLRRRVRWYVLADGVAQLCMIIVICFCVQITLDYLFRLRVDMRAVLLLGVMAAISVVIWRRIVAPLSVPLPVVDVAGQIENRFPHLRSSLISAVQFAEGEVGSEEANSPALMRRVIEQSVELAEKLPVQDLLDHGKARRDSFRVLAVLGFIVLFTVVAPEVMGTYFERNILLGSSPWKQNTVLIILNDEDGDSVVHSPRGDDLEIRIRAAGKIPSQVRIDLDFADDDHQQYTMTHVGVDEFRMLIPNLNQPLVFTVRGGDARNKPVQVLLVERPGILRARVLIHPPAYTMEQAFSLREGKSLIEALPGSGVEMYIVPSKPLSHALLRRDLSVLETAEPFDEGYRVRFIPPASATYTFELTDVDGLTNARPRPFIVRLVPDDPPLVSLQIKSVGDLVTPQAILPLQMEFKDRYGLDHAALVYHTDEEEGAPMRRTIQGMQPGAKQLLSSERFELSDLQLTTGRRLVLYAEAQDRNDVSGPGIGISTRYAFRVVSVEELLAELGRREQEFRQEFERLMNMQENIRSDLLSVASALQHSDLDDTPDINFAVYERRQRQLGRQVAHVQSQFQRIFDELTINQLGSREAEERLLSAIVRPLEALVLRAIPQAAGKMAALHASDTPESFEEVDDHLGRLLDDMRRIVVNMSKWEGFHETISLMQTIIRMQRELKEETDDTVNKQLEDIFGG